jgi:hypothetical protein
VPTVHTDDCSLITVLQTDYCRLHTDERNIYFEATLFLLELFIMSQCVQFTAST